MWKYLGQRLNLSCSCDLGGAAKARSFNPLCWARDWICISLVTPAAAVWFLTYCAAMGTPIYFFFILFLFFFMGTPVACGNSQVRNRIRPTTATQVTAVIMHCKRTPKHMCLNKYTIEISACKHGFLPFFLWLHLWPKEVPRLRVKSEQQLQAQATAVVTPERSRICDLCSHCGRAGSLTHSVRPEIKFKSSPTLGQALNMLSHSGNSYSAFKT